MSARPLHFQFELNGIFAVSYIRILLSRHHSPPICDKVSKLMIPIMYPIKFLPSIGQPTINLRSLYLRFTARRFPLLYNSVRDYVISPSPIAICSKYFTLHLQDFLSFFFNRFSTRDKIFQFINEIYVIGYERFAFA